MNEKVNEWMIDESLNEWNNIRINEKLNESMIEYMNRWLCGQEEKWTKKGWTNASISQSINLHKCTNKWLNEWMNELLNKYKWKN